MNQTREQSIEAIKDRNAAIIEANLQGKTYLEIADWFGVHPKTVARICKVNEEKNSSEKPITKRESAAADVQRSLDLRDHGYTNAEIAAIMGVSKNTVLIRIGRQPEAMTIADREFRKRMRQLEIEHRKNLAEIAESARLQQRHNLEELASQLVDSMSQAEIIELERHISQLKTTA